MGEGVLQFVISFGVALLWYRILFFVVPLYFKRPFTRSLLKLRWHHLHWGILIVFVGVISLLVSDESPATIVLLGIGLGFITDLFIPSLLLETDREKELEVYKNSFIPTLILAGAILGVILLISALY